MTAPTIAVFTLFAIAALLIGGMVGVGVERTRACTVETCAVQR